MSVVPSRSTNRSLKAFLLRRSAQKPFTKAQEALVKKLEAVAAARPPSLTAFLRSRS